MSDVEESYPGGADMEVVVKELGLNDDVTTAIKREFISALKNRQICSVIFSPSRF